MYYRRVPKCIILYENGEITPFFGEIEKYFSLRAISDPMVTQVKVYRVAS
jgi:hypothetical protein